MKTTPIAALVLCVLALAACGGRSAGQPNTVYVTLPTLTVEVPSSSMEPTLHCAQPGPGCEASVADGAAVQPIQANEVKRGDIILFNTPPLAKVKCGAGGRFLKRVIGMPAETWEERKGYVYINGKKARRVIHQVRPARLPDPTARPHPS